MIEYYKEALEQSPDQSRQILARAMEDDDVAVREVDELIVFAMDHGMEV